MRGRRVERSGDAGEQATGGVLVETQMETFLLSESFFLVKIRPCGMTIALKADYGICDSTENCFKTNDE